jgi:hypothetical protein
MLKASFPNARFVNTGRDPARYGDLDLVPAIRRPLGYAADLGDIAHHHRQYLRLMDHWRGTFRREHLRRRLRRLCAGIRAP